MCHDSFIRVPSKAPHSIQRALYSIKRALYSIKRALRSKYLQCRILSGVAQQNSPIFIKKAQHSFKRAQYSYKKALYHFKTDIQQLKCRIVPGVVLTHTNTHANTHTCTHTSTFTYINTHTHTHNIHKHLQCRVRLGRWLRSVASIKF